MEHLRGKVSSRADQRLVKSLFLTSDLAIRVMISLDLEEFIPCVDPHWLEGFSEDEPDDSPSPDSP